MKEQAKVLFVVYRTEWWGCFDSFCRQECHEGNLVYVMPIPRYDRELGTTKINYNKMRFHPERLEGELPEGAIKADYQTFSLEQGFDRIYIHNLYDNTYFVDSVDEKYYSWNLKQYTKRLVYISYLIFIEGIPEEYASSPVYDYVDAIYLTSKKSKYSLEVQYDRKVEIVPSGIPEYLEKLEEQEKRTKQSSQRKNADSPGTGQRKDKHEDRKGRQEDRKRLLCCLSYNNLFYGSEKLIQKLRDVFEYLRGRKDLLLIFRPDEDIRARFPWLDEPLQKKYAELVAYFQRYKIGMYDESPDLYRAAAEADGILSFGHPADNLFLVQGKYVLRLDLVQRPIPSDEVRCIPSLWAMTAEETEEGIELWFVPERTKLICRAVIGKDADGIREEKGKKAHKNYSNETEMLQVEIVAEVPDDVSMWFHYANITKAGNHLFLSPYQSEGVWKYNLETKCFREDYLPKGEFGYISITFAYEKYLYMLPKLYHGILKYDTETGKIEIIDGWVEELEHYVQQACKNYPYFCNAVKQEENMLYMASSKCDVWMEFNMEDDTWKIFSMCLQGKGFNDMVKKGDWVCLLPFCGEEVMLWNHVTCESRVLYSVSKEEESDTPYVKGVEVEDGIALFPACAEHVLLLPVDFSGGKPVEKEKLAQEIADDKMQCGKKKYLSEFQRRTKTGYEFVKKMTDRQIVVYEYYDGAFLILNEKMQVLKKAYCRLPIEAVNMQEDSILDSLQRKSEHAGILGEGYFLPSMIGFFQRRSEIRREERKRYYGEKLRQ